MRAAIYARRSTEEQQASLDRQVGECARYVEQQGWALVATYRESASGWRGDPKERPEFRRMIGDADGGAFDVLVVWEVSRLSRQGKKKSAVGIVWDLEDMGVQVRSVVDPTTGDEFADDLTLFLKSHLAKAESDTKARRVKSGKQEGVRKGVHQGRWAPYGYRPAGMMPSPTKTGRNVKRYEPDPEQAPILVEIVLAYVERGWSPQQICGWLNDRGVAPPARSHNHPYKRRGEPTWHQSTIRDLLSNPLTAGFVDYKGRRVKACSCADLNDESAWERWDRCEHEWIRCVNVAPPIVESDLWERSQAMLAARSRRRGALSGRGNTGSVGRFLLAGLVWCGECGERVGTRAAQRPGGRDLYVCRNRRLGKCSLPHIGRSLLDGAVRDHFVERRLDVIDAQATIERQLLDIHAKLDQGAGIVREEIAEVERERAGVLAFQRRVQDDYGAGKMSAKQWARLDADCEQRAERAEGALAHLRERLERLGRAGATEQIDAALDRLNRLRALIEGELTAETAPLLNHQLSKVFEELTLTRSGDRIIVDPKVRPEWIPEGTWRALDFGEDDHEGAQVVEVVDYLDPVLRKIDLIRGGDKVTDSS
jgi:DNA invertase Pin-like site-specific DNA recombinase